MSHDEKCKCEEKEWCCLQFREAWSPGSIYRPGDAVPYGGSSYVAIHWNQNDPPPSANWATIASKGDPGPAGPAGVPGPQGPAGSSGVTDLYSVRRSQDAGYQGVNMGSGGQQIASLDVPAGSYLVTAMAWLFNNDSDSQAWVLELHLGAAVFSKTSGTIPGTGGGPVGAGPVPGGGMILGTCTTAAPAAITLWGYGYSIYTQEIDFVALPVGTIHSS